MFFGSDWRATAQLVLGAARFAGARGVVRIAVAFLIAMATYGGRGATAEDDIQLPKADPRDKISIAADSALRWQQNAYDLWVLKGNCRIEQGTSFARAHEAVLWIEHARNGAQPMTKVIAYLEGNTMIDYYTYSGDAGGPEKQVARVTGSSWFGRFQTVAPLEIRTPPPGGEPQRKPPVFERGMARLKPDWGREIQQTQFVDLGTDRTTGPPPAGTRRVRIFPRSDVRIQAQSFPSPDGREQIVVLTSGVNVILDGLREGRVIDFAADRIVIWTRGGIDLSGESIQRDDVPLEVYMEGNIVFREGDRVITAERMFYDATNKVGMVLDAEVLTPVPGYQGLLRLKAAVVEQLGTDRFVARDALVTTSRLGEPGYHFASGTITFTDIQMPLFNPVTGEPEVDPVSGQPIVDHERRAESTNNFLYIGGIPVLYWPTMATDLEDPSWYIDSVTLRQDRSFGTQVLVNLDAYQLLGIANKPLGTDWGFDLDYLSERGIAGGTRFNYSRSDFFGLVEGNTNGALDAWFIDDEGLDRLGGGRKNVPPEANPRGRVYWRHRQDLPIDFTLTAEFGWISDRNFLEQYFESEWDDWKDESTGVELKRLFDNQSVSATTDVRLNEFFTETEWLPRLDHFILGESLLGDWLTWSAHTNVGYARMRTADAPTNPVENGMFTLLPWEAEVDGERFATRHELDLPLEVGPVKVVPYILGEFAHWGEALDGEDLQRFYTQTGVRASVPFSKVDPTIENHLLNVHGLAHKVTFDTELSFSDANQDVGELPLYDAIDDNAQEQFRRRFTFNTFGGVVPPQFDPRLYAIRSSIGSWVASPSTELADDMLKMRVGMEHRWQTKRGRPGERRIVDWIVLDTNATWFPRANDDNFGEPFGLVDYNFRWHVGDRVTLVSDGMLDFFGDGGRFVTVGGYLNRPPRGSLYLGFRSLEGPFSSNVFQTKLRYRMSHKWITSYGTSIDVSQLNSVTHKFTLTRIGESLLVRAGFAINSNKDEVGLTLMVEPRFFARTLGAGVVDIPPAGAFGLE